MYTMGNKTNNIILICECVKVTLSRPTPLDPMDYSPPGSSVSGILQVRILELHIVMCMFPCYSLNHPTVSFPHCVCKSALYITSWQTRL